MAYEGCYTFLPALGHDKAQNIIDQITQAYESGSGPPPGGVGFTAASLSRVRIESGRTCGLRLPVRHPVPV